jgi:hypothetical protein
MSVFEDAFTDTAGTVLTSHTPVLIAGGTGSGSWGGNASVVISNANRCRSNAGSGISCIESIAPANASYTVEADFVIFTMPGSALYAALISHGDTNSTSQGRHGYQIQLSNNVLTLAALSASGATLGTVSGGTWNTGGGSTAVYHVALTVAQTGSNYAITVLVTNSSGQYLTSGGTYQSGQAFCISTTVNSGTGNEPGGATTIPTIGAGGVVFFETTITDSTGIHFDNFKVTNFVSALVTSSNFTAATATSLSGTGSAAGGVSPYTYQWQRSTVADSGYSNLSGATSASFTDSTVTPGVMYFYKLQVTDSASTIATSSVVSHS